MHGSSTPGDSVDTQGRWTPTTSETGPTLPCGEHGVASVDGVDSSDATAVDPSETRSVRSVVADSLASAVLTMFLLTVVQRGTGFFRNILLCRLLAPEDLGYWNMAKSFLVLVAPLVVLGLPGAFKRYLTYYRERGQLMTFVRRTTRMTIGLTIAGVGMTLVFREQLAWATFGTEDRDGLMIQVGMTLLFVVAFNCSVELLTALRQVRTVSFLQLVNSLAFTISSLTLVGFWGLRASGIVASFGFANLLTAIMGILAVRRTLAVEPHDVAPGDDPIRLWHKLGPFAAWFWLGDLLSNLFGNVDRVMIIHFAEGRDLDALTMVGQYHSSQIIGILLIGLTGMLGGILLSYLSHDWETGQRDRAAHTLDFAIKLSSLALTAGAAIALLVAPIIFEYVLDNKYSRGFEVLPMTMTYCIWFGLLGMAHNILWCREKAWLVSLSLGSGLILNVILNYLWLPLWGLPGAVAATTVANLTTLVIVFWMGHLLGMAYTLGSVVAVATPASLCLGGIPAILVVGTVVCAGIWRGWLFTPEQSERFVSLMAGHRLWRNDSTA